MNVKTKRVKYTLFFVPCLVFFILTFFLNKSALSFCCSIFEDQAMTHAIMLLEYSKIHSTQSKMMLRVKKVEFSLSFYSFIMLLLFVFFTYYYYSSIGIDSCNTDDISIQSIARCNRSLSRLLCF